MNLGWSDDGYGDLRASNSDRQEVRLLLDVARDEGRLDEAEYDRRVGTLPVAKTRGDLVRVTADLPARKGVREWADGLRVRGEDREDARRWLDEAAEQGRLADQEYEQRLVALSAVVTYDELTVLLDGVPGWSGTSKKDALAGTADRDKALALLDEAVADGRVRPVEAPAMEATIRQARRRRDIDLLLAPLAERVSDRERQHTVEALAAAHQAGQLDATEYATRAGRAQEATAGTDLTPLVADLQGGERRLTESDRQEAAATLKRALDEGRLDLTEFDERVATAHAATTAADLAPLVADLSAPPRPKRRRPGDGMFDYAVANSALIAAPRHQILKLAWKTYVLAVVLAYVYFLVQHTILAVAVLWAPTVALLMAGSLLKLFAGPVDKREQAIVDGLRPALRRLRAKQPAIKELTIKYPALEWVEDDGERKVKTRSDVAQINVRFRSTDGSNELPPRVRDEITRLFWRSRLYPLNELWFKESREYTEDDLGTVKLDGDEKGKLRHRYGPRPYGPYQEEQSVWHSF